MSHILDAKQETQAKRRLTCASLRRAREAELVWLVVPASGIFSGFSSRPRALLPVPEMGPSRKGNHHLITTAL